MLFYYLPLFLTLLASIVRAEKTKSEHTGSLRNVLFPKEQEHENEKPNNDVKAKDPLSLRVDLAAFSDDELIRLADVLQDELKKYDEAEESVSELAAEPLVLIPSELVKEPKKRSRRSQSHGKVMMAQAFSPELLQRLTKTEPLIIVPEMDDDVSRPAYVTVDEKQLDPLSLSASEIDELELRSRIAQLSDLLRERALRGL